MVFHIRVGRGMIHEINVTFAVVLLGVVQAIFGIFYISTAKEKSDYNKVLMVWLAFLALPMLGALFHGFDSPTIKLLFRLKSYPFTFGPLFYFYTKLLINPDKRFGLKDLVHFIPFVLFGILDFIFPQLLDPGHRGRSSLFILIYRNISVLTFIVYTFLVMKMLRQYRLSLRDYFSFENNQLRLNWIPWITVIFIGHFIIIPLLPKFIPRSTGVSPLLVQNIVFDFLIFSLCYFAFRQESIKKGIVEEEPPKKQYKKPNLTDDNADVYVSELIAYMEKEKPYLDSGLTLPILSEKLSIPKHYITEILNTKLHKNFFTFVNEYRIEYIKQQLSSKENDNLSILGIALDGGFSSKSGFNAAFKKIVGCTPSEYRNRSE